MVLEQIVTTMATVADTVEEAFVPYYDKFMPSLKYIMGSVMGKEYRMLRGKTIECISLIGLAVGQEKVRIFPIINGTIIVCISEIDNVTLCDIATNTIVWFHIILLLFALFSSCKMPRM